MSIIESCAFIFVIFLFFCTITNNFSFRYSLNFLFLYYPTERVHTQSALMSTHHKSWWGIIFLLLRNREQEYDKQIRTEQKLKTFWMREKLWRYFIEFLTSLDSSACAKSQLFLLMHNERKTFFFRFLRTRFRLSQCTFHAQLIFNKAPVIYQLSSLWKCYFLFVKSRNDFRLAQSTRNRKWINWRRHNSQFLGTKLILWNCIFYSLRPWTLWRMNERIIAMRIQHWAKPFSSTSLCDEVKMTWRKRNIARNLIPIFTRNSKTKIN